MSSEPSYFVRLDEHRYRPLAPTGGAWSTNEQHISPMIGLITHAVERYLARRGTDDLAISRISVDILGVLTLEPFDIEVEVLRPGRTIELLEATVTSAGRAAVRARIWRAVATDTATVAGGEAEPLPDPKRLEPLNLTGIWPGGYIDSLDIRLVGAAKPGRATAWAAAKPALVADEPVTDFARLIGLIDTANGLSVRQSPDAWLFPNLDLTIHLTRRPAGDWLGLDTTVVFGPTGLGLTTSLLHDTTGHFGYAQQTLTLRPRTALTSVTTSSRTTTSGPTPDNHTVYSAVRNFRDEHCFNTRFLGETALTIMDARLSRATGPTTTSCRVQSR